MMMKNSKCCSVCMSNFTSFFHILCYEHPFIFISIFSYTGKFQNENESDQIKSDDVIELLLSLFQTFCEWVRFHLQVQTIPPPQSHNLEIASFCDRWRRQMSCKLEFKFKCGENKSSLVQNFKIAFKWHKGAQSAFQAKKGY